MAKKKEEIKGVKGYKAFRYDLSCCPNIYYSKKQYKIGHTYRLRSNQKLGLCKRGFHFCKELRDVFKFYPINERTRVCEVLALGDVIDGSEGKSVTNIIKIVREIENPLALCDEGKANTGSCNKGDRNTGDLNIGYGNTGDNNTGDDNTGNLNMGSCNTGDDNYGVYNSGNYNIGNYNTRDYNRGGFNSGGFNIGDNNTGSFNCGNYNTNHHNIGNSNSGGSNKGMMNSGYFNIGDCNSGFFNKCDYSTGFFCTKTPNMMMFNKPTDLTYEQIMESAGIRLLLSMPKFSVFHRITNNSNTELLTKDEKESYVYKTYGKYYKITAITSEERQAWWDKLKVSEKKSVRDLPNFDSEIFKEITGIDPR